MTVAKRSLIDPAFIRALNHPLRAELLDRLGEGVFSPNYLAGEMDEALSAVAYHVRILNECGCLDLVREEPRRGAQEHFYRAKPEAFIGGRQWRMVPRSVRAWGVSAATLQSLFDKAVKALKAGTIDSREDTTLSCMSLAVDEQGWGELAQAADEFLGIALGVHKASTRRLGDSDGIPVVLGVSAFQAAGFTQPREGNERW